MSWFSVPRPYTTQLPSDGRPMSGLPVFICTSAEPWAWVSVWQERITAILSACSRVFGKKSEIGIPLCPQALNGRQAGVSMPSARPPELMNFSSGGIG